MSCVTKLMRNRCLVIRNKFAEDRAEERREAGNGSRRTMSRRDKKER